MHFCNDLNLACGQCLHRISNAQSFKAHPLFTGSTWFVSPQLSRSVAVLGTQNTKAFGLGFSHEPGTGGKPTLGEHWEHWSFQAHAEPHCKLILQKSSEVCGRMSDLGEGLEQLGVWGVLESRECSWSIPCPYTFHFSIYIGKRLTTPSASTYWTTECKPGPYVTCEGVTVSFSTFDLRPF